MTTRLLAPVMIAFASWLAASTASAQSGDDDYARGVLAYFNGASHQAESLLTEALADDPEDPRAYYFRGLAKIRTGRSYEGEQDFRIGAAMEAGWTGRPIHMGRTLERVQGSDRLMLERIRSEARKGHKATRAANMHQRYQRTTDRGKEVIRSDFRLPLGTLTDAAHPDDLATLVLAQANSAGDPFADDPVEKTPVPIDIPEPARGAMTTEDLGGVMSRVLGRLLPSPSIGFDGGDTRPFGPGANGMPGGEDPFGSGSEDPFGGVDEVDPFGSADEVDPFGSPAEEPMVEAPLEDDPFGSDSADPFGDGGGMEEDPFGEGSSEEDPFGGF